MQVKIEKLDNFGRGITYVNKKICFIENSLPEEIIEIDIINEKKKYIEAKPIIFLKKSNNRIKEECPYSALCGGCHLNHLSFEEENIFKSKKVEDIMIKYGKINSQVIENITYQNRNNYRNKVTLHGSNNKIGFYKKGTHKIIPIKKCLQLNPTINMIIEILNKINKNIKEVTIKTSNDNLQSMIEIKGEITDIEKIKNIADVLIINNKYYTQEKTIKTKIGNKSYYESIHSFFQINNTLTTTLYDEVLSIVKENNYSNVLDLYCGTGTIGIYISDYVKRVIGVDYNPSNISDANKNKLLNDCKNIEFICDKVENRIQDFHNIDLIIVDPPRKGLDQKTRDYIKKIHPQKIIYVSCEPITLARDLEDLQILYKIKKIKPFNMFPRTYHCESIAVLERK